jgi:3-hydroxyisobutyrate dehydrogenase-like beta-hydroxyacid dehydrogenase
MDDRIGLIGLGAMGLPMGRRLLDRGFKLVVVPHVNRAPAEELAALGAEVASSPGEVAATCAVAITSVPDAPQVREVLFSEGGLASSPEGRQSREGLLASGQGALLHIDMSTIAPSAAREFSTRLESLGIEALDAPVSGGPMRAADGTLTIMVGGKPEAFERARPVLAALGQHVVHVGESGAGQVVKLANQLMISMIMVANAEALTLGVKSGVPLDTLLEVIGTSSGSNYLMQNWLPRTLFTGDLSGGFSLDLLMKDLAAALQSARELGLPAFGGALAQQLYAMARAEHGGKLDYSVVARLYEQATGVTLRR